MNTADYAHVPQRLAGEKFSDYKERRRLSHGLAMLSLHGMPTSGRFVENTNPQRRARRAAARAKREAINQPKPLAARKYKAKDPVAATWPKSKDQKRQSRPVIITRPLKHIHERRPDQKTPDGKWSGLHRTYALALRAANFGMGDKVQRIARGL